ncbi:UDP-N-acetylmuramate dehydrogenase [Treponema putidum]|uniref:UDP-N-acetylenolpyruvoylglucosamine reductase n=1 Tax=Treponema putidum TaxID=221027 RepID=A0AAE9MU06_9SPIR|nr:UDP-N-acetylmuramate dehydrogenase [Treponema putidum]AIN93540.1 UDP-N-acetylenolpyruvoylglucosamine reductase [Treponema putidum]TWI75753.1 UDP-N-acetylmuramate dehydrogenase [Treponema putidum]UTY29789.1 UDP-N-acetylmuramate dehydrogenase [Treponema putidum]UTY34649.1 UDP-N-acetylmuramate dehydrogenase [Treponema putidum]
MNNLFSILHNTPLFQEGSIEFDKTLKPLTAYKIGGNAEAFFCPKNEEHLKEALIFLLKNKIPVSLIGGGANILVSDKGFRGVLISLKNLNKIEIIGESENKIFVRAGAGVLTDNLTKWAVKNSLSGLECFGGLPGNVGGAVFMNARCYDVSISDRLKSVKYILADDGKTEFAEYKYNPSDWGYKVSPFQQNPISTEIRNNRKIVISAVFTLTYGIKEEIAAKTEEKIQDRISKGHFKAPSAGSTFKNNRTFGQPSGKLIEDAGLKGLCEGGAQVAPWHGNFIINKKDASASDVKILIEKVQKNVKDKTGFLLEPEVIFAGDWE